MLHCVNRKRIVAGKVVVVYCSDNCSNSVVVFNALSRHLFVAYKFRMHLAGRLGISTTLIDDLISLVEEHFKQS